jgi:hypothetical protein
VSEEERPDTPQAGEPDAQEAPVHAHEAPPDAQEAPDEEEIRRRLEEQLRKVRVQDLLLESLAGILNLTARRIAKDDERDLEQGRLGIEVARAVVGLLDEEPARQVREAISQLQVLYASHAQGGPAEPSGEPGGGPGEGAPPSGGGPGGGGAGPAPQRPRSSGLWTPGSG